MFVLRFLFSGIGANALNLGGSGGQSPPALASADDLLMNVSCVVCVCWAGVVSLNRGPLFAGSIAVVLFVRNTNPAIRQGDSRTRLHPDTSLREFGSRVKQLPCGARRVRHRPFLVRPSRQPGSSHPSSLPSWSRSLHRPDRLETTTGPGRVALG